MTVKGFFGEKEKTPKQNPWNSSFNNNILNTYFNVIFSNEFYYLY